MPLSGSRQPPIKLDVAVIPVLIDKERTLFGVCDKALRSCRSQNHFEWNSEKGNYFGLLTLQKTGR